MDPNQKQSSLPTPLPTRRRCMLFNLLTFGRLFASVALVKEGFQNLLLLFKVDFSFDAAGGQRDVSEAGRLVHILIASGRRLSPSSVSCHG